MSGTLRNLQRRILLTRDDELDEVDHQIADALGSAMDRLLDDLDGPLGRGTAPVKDAESALLALGIRQD